MFGGNSPTTLGFPHTKKHERVFITHVHLATDSIVPSLSSTPSGLYIVVEFDDKTTKTSNQAISGCTDVVEWDDEILLPLQLACPISFKVYASFELGSTMAGEELLQQFKTTVGDLLDCNEDLHPVDFLDKRMSSLHPSLRIATEPRAWDADESMAGLDVSGSDAMNQLSNTGYCALLCYCQDQNQRDLDEAVMCFERVRDLCPSDHPNRSVVLFNLATVKFVHCRNNHLYRDLDVAVALYRDALQLRTGRCVTALELCLAILARLQRPDDVQDRTGVEDLLFEEVMGYAYQAAWLALQMTGITVSIRAIKSTMPQAHHADHSIEMSIRKTRIKLLDLPEGDPRQQTLLADLGSLLYGRFQENNDLADIHEAISILDNAIQFISDDHRHKPEWLNDLGNALLSRFELLGELADLNKSCWMLEESVHLTRDDDPVKYGRLSNFGHSLRCRFERTGDLADINKSVIVYEEVVLLTLHGHPSKATQLSNLANSIHLRFECLGQFADLDRSILLREEVVRLTPDDHPYKPARLSSLGNSLSSRFDHFGDLSDLDKSISLKEKAVYLSSNDHSTKPALLNNHANELATRFRFSSDPSDIDKSISMHEEAIHFTSTEHPNKSIFLYNLGSSLLTRFVHFGDPLDIQKSISMSNEAAHLTPNGHPEKPGHLNIIASSLLYHFKHFGDLADLKKSISMFEEAVSLIPKEHPDRLTLLNNLGLSLTYQFEHSGDLEDNHRSISIFDEMVLLIPNGHPNRPSGLTNLGASLFYRFKHLGCFTDLEKSILAAEEAMSLTPDGHPDKPGRLTNLANPLLSQFEQFGNLADINKAISLYDDAVHLTSMTHPEKPIYLNNLGYALLHHFEHVGDLADIDKSILVLEKAVQLLSKDHITRPAALKNLGLSLIRRFEHLGDLADINRSIDVNEQAIGLTPGGHPDKADRLSSLGSSLFYRYRRLGNLEDLDTSVAMSEEAVQLTPNGSPNKPTWLSNLGLSLSCRFRHTSDPVDIDRSISILEEAVHLTPNGRPDKTFWLNNLGNSLLSRFEHNGDTMDLSKAISMIQEAIDLAPEGYPNRAAYLILLGNLYGTQFERSHDPSDLCAATLRFSEASCSSTGPISTRFLAACRWISSAHQQDNSEAILDAYTTTISLLPQLAWLGLPLTERHRVLSDAADIARDAGAAALEAGRPNLAIEWLEQGRSIVWGQHLQLRSPIDELFVKNSALARQFEQISQELERAGARDRNLTHKLSLNEKLVGDTAAQSLEEEVQRHHNLALERENLLAEIRSLPGFERFLLPKAIEQLTSLANSGPVVYLNASIKRCDALIVGPKLGGAIPVPLPNICYEELEFWQGILRLLLEHNRLISRDDISAFIRAEENPVSRQCLDSLLAEDSVEVDTRAVKAKPQRMAGKTPDELFLLILAYLWDQVVNPVLEALGFLNLRSDAEKLPRIFWCPTGPFAFLPVHAAGRHGSGSVGKKLSDFAISSYIPTLSALVPSTKQDLTLRSPDIHLLAVPQPPDDGQSRLTCVQDEMDHIRMSSANSSFVTLLGSDGAVEDVTAGMVNADWVHFACHGVQDPDNPLDSGLCLANHRRLKLSDIIRLSRPQGGLAFLSACQTARGDEKLAEESVHLAAGMLLAGYGSVIATMWAITDREAPRVARDVYEYLFRDGKVPDSTEAAEALHHAVQNLRESGASFSSWVPFIHVGR